MLEEVGMKKVEKVQFVASYFSPESLSLPVGCGPPTDRRTCYRERRARAIARFGVKKAEGGGNSGGVGEKSYLFIVLCARMTIHN